MASPIALDLSKSIRSFFYKQFFITPAVPTKSFSSQTVIVTGSNTGLGLEAARRIYRLDCAKLILAVRSASKGEAAKEDIVRSVPHRSDPDAIEIWELDLSSTASTLAFSERVKGLDRVDVLLENAGINHMQFELSEGFEMTTQVNVLNTFLLALEVLPKLRETKKKFEGSEPHLTIVSSEVHGWSTFPESAAEDLFARLNEKDGYDGRARYNVSKLMEVLFVREFVARLGSTSTAPPVIINMVNPGLCKSSLLRDPPLHLRIVLSLMSLILARTTEVGSRPLVLAACAGQESHGEFMSDGFNEKVEGWIYGNVGKQLQEKVFEQTLKILEQRKKGVAKSAGL